MGAIQVQSKMVFALSMAPMGSARLPIARLLPIQEDSVPDMAVARPKCATLTAARRLLKHAVVALGMVHMGGARVMDAPPRHYKGSSIASNMVAGRRRSRAPWRAAPPLLTARASVANMAVAKVNARWLAALTRCTAFSRPARSTAGAVTASTHQDASGQQPSTAQIARSTPRRRRRIKEKTNGKSLCVRVSSSALAI